MPIAGMNITNVNISRSGDFSGSYQMNCNTSIKDLKEQELPQIKKKGLSVPLEFSATYSDGKGKPIAEIKISGDVLFLDEKNEQVLKDWKSEKKIPEAMSVQIMNLIMRDVLTRTVQATDLLRLPMPLPIPSLSMEKPKMEERKK